MRPLLIATCISCHGNLPLHDPGKWDLLHQHQEEVKTPDLLRKWVEEGSTVDPHWAGLPLRKVSGNSVDDFLEASPDLETERKAPHAMFSASVQDILAGDLMDDHTRAISTGYLRRKEDSPKWRAEMVAREFLGVRIECASCHDHPSEHWSMDRYSKLKALFTTPYDDLPNALPPLLVKISPEEADKIAELQEELEEARQEEPIVDPDYLDWLALDEGTPTLPGLVAAYSFDGGSLSNLSPLGKVQAEGKSLIAEESAHGEGLVFDGNNELVLTDLPGCTELDRFTISAWVKLSPAALADSAIFTIGSRARGFEFRVVGGRLQARWTRFWPQIAIAITSKFPLIIPDRWSHLAVTYDGSRQAEGLKIYLNGLPIAVEAAPTQLMKSVLSPGTPLMIAGNGLSLDELQIFEEALTPLGVQQVFDGRSLLSAYQNGDDLREFYQAHLAQAEQSRRMRVRALNEDLLGLENHLPAYQVMADDPQRELPEDDTEPANRLEFAQRLNQDLLARSLANEVWRRHFRSPLAQTLGFSDPLPTHPDLLEWLAGQLQKNDFDIAKLGEIIRSSKAWTQEWPAPEADPAICPRSAD